MKITAITRPCSVCVCYGFLAASHLLAQSQTRINQTTSGMCSPAIVNTGSGTVKVEITGSCNGVDQRQLRDLVQQMQRFLNEYPRTQAAMASLLTARNNNLEARIREMEAWMKSVREPIEQARLTPQDAQRWDLLQPGEELFSNTIFRMPRGWRRQMGNAGALILMPQHSEFPRIIIEKSEVLAAGGGFRALYEQRLQAISISTGAIESIATQEGFPVLIASATIAGPSRYENISAAYIAANPGNRFEQITFANQPGGFEIPSGQLLTPFLNSVDYVNSRASRPK